MINRVVLVGRLTKDLVLRKTLNDKSVVQFTLACNRNVSKDGEQNVDFINCIAWNKVAELMVQYLHKGSLIGIDGRIQTRNYQDKSGRTVYLTEVVVEQQQFLEPKSAQHSNENAQGYNHTMQSNFNESYSLTTHTETLPEDIAKYYEPKNRFIMAMQGIQK